MWPEQNAPQKCRTNSWLLFHDNAPAHRTVSVKDFLFKNVKTLEHPPYSPDVDTADFYLYPRLKLTLKRRRSEEYFTKWLPGMFPAPLQWLP
jgi:hypothetical protein